MDTPLQFRARHPDSEPLLKDGRAARALRVLVDAPIWERLQSTEKIPEIVLRQLLAGDGIEMSLYGDDGPPPDAPRRAEDSS
ncbi:hypothetical protein [Microbacterium sulfonylureivorans]|uniref:hypothetical protein n=1 Tax=Microbacterium sulfonylureivorans TaxID=2486854 RepID=UPI000FD7CEAC|nr:hypothetical protein [Microbacterium sulfonylureivorans]